MRTELHKAISKHREMICIQSEVIFWFLKEKIDVTHYHCTKSLAWGVQNSHKRTASVLNLRLSLCADLYSSTKDVRLPASLV